MINLLLDADVLRLYSYISSCAAIRARTLERESAASPRMRKQK